jgi:3-hydroxyisobutyrate dehydrogenase-like beta-hydroxyacid dehydrogenase
VKTRNEVNPIRENYLPALLGGSIAFFSIPGDAKVAKASELTSWRQFADSKVPSALGTLTDHCFWELAAQVHFHRSGEMQCYRIRKSYPKAGWASSGSAIWARPLRRLAAKFHMVVYDRDRAKAEELRAPGVAIADDPRTLAADVDVVLSCLPDGAAVEDLYLGSGNVLRSARAHASIIELSTVAPETSRKLHETAGKYGISMLDVAISGSSPAAAAGVLTLFGGGGRGEFESAEPIFAAIASQWFYMGPSGSGVAMKLVVNTLLGLGMRAIAEALALGSRLDLPRDLLYSTLAKTARGGLLRRDTPDGRTVRVGNPFHRAALKDSASCCRRSCGDGQATWMSARRPEIGAILRHLANTTVL